MPNSYDGIQLLSHIFTTVLPLQVNFADFETANDHQILTYFGYFLFCVFQIVFKQISHHFGQMFSVIILVFLQQFLNHCVAFSNHFWNSVLLESTPLSLFLRFCSIFSIFFVFWKENVEKEKKISVICFDWLTRRILLN